MPVKKITTLLAFLGLLSISTALQGFDVSIYQGGLSVDDFTCIKKLGYSLAILQAWSSQGLNSFFSSNFQNALIANVPYVDMYASICSQCQMNNATQFCSDLKQIVPTNFDGRLWLSIGPCDGCWGLDSISNLDFIVNITQACIGVGFRVGIYSSLAAWGAVLGDPNVSSPVLTPLDLWYVHYDNDAGFDDFALVSFGGWTSPTLKQYEGALLLCGILVDGNFSE